MGTKGVSFGYLRFSRAIRGKPCPHAHARTRRSQTGLGLGFPTRSSSFWTGSHGYGLPAPPSGSEPNQLNGWQKTAANSWAFLSETNRCNGSDWTIATVQSGSDGFTPPECYKYRSFSLISIHTQNAEAIQKRKTSSFGTSATQIQKWLPTGSRNSATRIPKWLPPDSFWKKAQKIQQIL